MSEIIFLLIFVVWYFLSVIFSENLGKKSKIGIEWSFFLCMILSPVIGWVVLKANVKRV
jgi:hypothetical protein